MRKYLARKWTGRGKLFADEIAGGDVRDTEKVTKTTSIGPLADTRASKKYPLNVPIFRILAGKMAVKTGRQRGSSRRAELRRNG